MTIAQRGSRARLLRAAGWIAVALALLPLAGCKNFGSPDYTLDIAVASGINGSPLAGHYVYHDLSEVAYSYTAQNSDLGVTVNVNSISFAASGNFTMYCNLSVVVDLLDVRGSWDATLTPSDTSASQIKFVLTLDGSGLASGAFSDDQGRHGTWAFSTQTLTLTYGDWEKVILTGTAGTSGNTLSGSYSNGDATGTWSAARKTS